MSRSGSRFRPWVAAIGLGAVAAAIGRKAGVRRLIDKAPAPAKSDRLIDKAPNFIPPTDRSIIREITEEEAGRYENIGLSDKDRVLLLDNVRTLIAENDIVLREGDAEWLLQQPDMKAKLPRTEEGKIDFPRINEMLSGNFARMLVARKVKGKLAERG